MTGLEALLGPSIAKAAATGVTRAGIWGSQKIFEAKRKRKIRALLDSKGDSKCADLLASLDQNDVDKVLSFCQSSEFNNCSLMLTRARLIEGQGRKSEKVAAAVRGEIEEGLRLHLGHAPESPLPELLFSALNESVTLNIKRLSDSDISASPTLKAELIKTIGSLASAGVRNVDLMQSLASIGEINEFASDFRSHIAATSGTMRLPHAGAKRRVAYEQLFVQPRLHVRQSTNETAQIAPLQLLDDEGKQARDLLEEHTRMVILGDPGGGKSTLSRHLIFQIAAEDAGSLARVPFFVELKEYAKSLRDPSNKQTVVEYLEGVCRAPNNSVPPKDAIEYLLLNDRAVVVLDGLDELLDTSLRRTVVEIVESFSYKFPTCPILVTSRKIGYDEAPLDPHLFSVIDLDEFDDNDVNNYVEKWFRLEETIKEDLTKKRFTESFIEDSEFVSDLRHNPLLLSLMCGIYASENYIPTNRPDVYEKCSLLLFERWDKQRGIERPLSFDAHVQAAMRSLALYMLTNSEDATLPRLRTLEFMKSYLLEKRFDNEEDAENAANEFIEFCQGRAWVLTDVGSETYGFTHRTFLEYFSASQLVKQNSSADKLYRILSSKIQAKEWDVVAQLSLQILGKQVEDGADDFLLLAMADCDKRTMSSEERNIVSFVTRSLQFLVPKPIVLQKICDLAIEYSREPGILFSVTTHAAPNETEWPIVDLRHVAKENITRVGDTLRASVKKSFSANGVEERILFAATVAFTYFSIKTPSSLAYWIEWTTENAEVHFRHIIDQKLDEYWWLGILELERDGITLRHMLSLHGATSLYRYEISGLGVAKPPLAFRQLAGGSGLITDSYRDEKSRAALRRRVRRQLSSEFSTIMSMRVKMSPAELRPITGLISEGHSRAITRTSELILLLPLIEDFVTQIKRNIKASNEIKDRVTSQYSGLFRASILSRLGFVDEVPRALHLARPLLNRNEDALEKFKDWLECRITLIQRPRRTSSSTSGASESP
ncbi:NACHT domain-containing protein [Amycolatopsis sp. DG1A-15b]|uniref:NACHT domain-containing protein n=1 Tax=Amycolatopsis sp. DG1A-15b TaxID=3052846 RepID=UPI00255B9EFE|nr:NACHT domain-containing protein [Amycolatopsis sp. DG1A-15b]WIX85517.1 NACHT domain-containing protein [Amycolatopsis sp. DG1A-15b]